MAAQGQADATRVVEALRPWANRRHYVNFAEHQVDTSSGFDGADFARLQRIRAAATPTASCWPTTASRSLRPCPSRAA